MIVFILLLHMVHCAYDFYSGPGILVENMTNHEVSFYDEVIYQTYRYRLDVPEINNSYSFPAHGKCSHMNEINDTFQDMFRFITKKRLLSLFRTNLSVPDEPIEPTGDNNVAKWISALRTFDEKLYKIPQPALFHSPSLNLEFNRNPIPNGKISKVKIEGEKGEPSSIVLSNRRIGKSIQVKCDGKNPSLHFSISLKTDFEFVGIITSTVPDSFQSNIILSKAHSNSKFKGFHDQSCDFSNIFGPDKDYSLIEFQCKNNTGYQNYWVDIGISFKNGNQCQEFRVYELTLFPFEKPSRKRRQAVLAGVAALGIGTLGFEVSKLFHSGEDLSEVKKTINLEEVELKESRKEILTNAKEIHILSSESKHLFDSVTEQLCKLTVSESKLYLDELIHIVLDKFIQNLSFLLVFAETKMKNNVFEDLAKKLCKSMNQNWQTEGKAKNRCEKFYDINGSFYNLDYISAGNLDHDDKTMRAYVELGIHIGIPIFSSLESSKVHRIVSIPKPMKSKTDPGQLQSSYHFIRNQVDFEFFAFIEIFNRNLVLSNKCQQKNGIFVCPTSIVNNLYNYQNMCLNSLLSHNQNCKREIIQSSDNCIMNSFGQIMAISHHGRISVQPIRETLQNVIIREETLDSFNKTGITVLSDDTSGLQISCKKSVFHWIRHNQVSPIVEIKTGGNQTVEDTFMFNTFDVLTKMHKIDPGELEKSDDNNLKQIVRLQHQTPPNIPYLSSENSTHIWKTYIFPLTSVFALLTVVITIACKLRACCRKCRSKSRAPDASYNAAEGAFIIS